MPETTEVPASAGGCSLEPLVSELVQRLAATQKQLNSMEADHLYHNRAPYHSDLSIAYNADTDALIVRAETALSANDRHQGRSLAPDVDNTKTVNG